MSGADRGRDVQRMVAPGMATPMRGPLARLGPPAPPPEDDGATIELLRYAQATDVAPAPDLAARVQRRIAAEPRPIRSRWRAAFRALDPRAPRRAARMTGADLSRAPVTAPRRSPALGLAAVALVVLGGGAATGLAAAQLLKPSSTEENSLVPPPPTFVEGVTLLASHEPSEPPGVLLTDPMERGIGPGGAASPAALASPDAEPVPLVGWPEPPTDDIDPGDGPTDGDDTSIDPGRGHARPDHRGRGPDGAAPPNGPKTPPKDPKAPPTGPRPKDPKDPPDRPNVPDGPKEPKGPQGPPRGPNPREASGPKDPPNGPRELDTPDAGPDGEPVGQRRGRRSA